jgi:hypothetical protein
MNLTPAKIMNFSKRTPTLMKTHRTDPVASQNPSRCCFALLFALMLAGAFTVRAASTPPDFMTYQGFLVDGNGNPLATNNPANYPVIFRIYTAATGGTRLWSEQQIVTVDKGSFSVVLGEGTVVGGEAKPALSSVFTGATASDRYISISVTIGGSTPEILPRLRLLPSPYSFLATSAANLVTPAGSNVVSFANNRVEIEGGTRIGGDSFPSLMVDSSNPIGTWAALGNSSAGGRYWQLISSGSGNGEGAGKLLLGSGPAAASTGIKMTFQDNGNIGVGTSTPNAPLSFGGGLANTKLALWDGGPGSMFGFGIQPSQFRFHVNTAVDRFSFLNGVAGAEVMTIQGGGSVGIGVASPAATLHINGGMRINGGNTLEFGSGVAGKEASAGKIGYQAFTGDALDIVGAGTTGGNRKVKIWSEGGATIAGSLGIGAQPPARALHVNGADTVMGRFDSSSAIGTWFALGNSSIGGRYWQLISTGSGNGEGAGKLLIASGVTDGQVNSIPMTFQNNGFVGVGTATPADHLHLRGGSFRIDDNSTRYIRMYRTTDGLILEGNSMFHGPNQAIIWNGDNNWDSTSDRTLKKDITDAESVLDRLMQLPVRRYRWNEDQPDMAKKFGVIAQEVQPFFPDVVGRMVRPSTSNEVMTVKYGAFGLIAVKALQELKAEKDAERATYQKEIEELKQEVEQLRGKLVKTARVDALEQELDELKHVVRRLAATPPDTQAAVRIGKERADGASSEVVASR